MALETFYRTLVLVPSSQEYRHSDIERDLLLCRMEMEIVVPKGEDTELYAIPKKILANLGKQPFLPGQCTIRSTSQG